MSLSLCTSCLARLQLSRNVLPSTPTSAALKSSIPSSSSTFHTSAPKYNVLKKKVVQPGVRAPKLRESRSAIIKKKKVDRPKPPPVGQRRTERKRIVLSNTNALEIMDLEKLSAENMLDAAKVGQVLSLDGPLLDQLRDAQAFKTTQNWNLFRAPSTLQRSESAELGGLVKQVNDSRGPSGTPVTAQNLIVGEKACGKSIQLLQAMSMAYLNKWVVINIPDCQEFVMNQSAYAPVPLVDGQDASQQMYTQPQLAADLLARLANSNSTVLSNLKLVHKHGETISQRKPKNLKELALMGADDRFTATKVWDAMWKELTVAAPEQKSSRPPICIAIDGINFWMSDTKYKSADYKTIHAHQFTLIKQFTDLLFSKTANPLPNGGMVVACTTKSNHPPTPAFDLLTRQLEARRAGLTPSDPAFPQIDPFAKKPDVRVTSLFDPKLPLSLTNLHGLTRSESKGLLEYFARSGIFKEAVDDRAVAEKWSLSGGGIVGELCKLGVRSRYGILPITAREGVKSRV